MDLGGEGRRIEKDKENSKQNTQGKGLQTVGCVQGLRRKGRCRQHAEVWLLFLGAPEDKVPELPLMSACVRTQAK